MGKSNLYCFADDFRKRYGVEWTNERILRLIDEKKLVLVYNGKDNRYRLEFKETKGR